MHPDARAWQQRGHDLRTPGGDRLFVVDEAPSGEEVVAPPLLLLHGFPTSSFDWRHVWTDLNQGRRLLALDFLGYGLSDKPDRAYSLFDQADHAVRVVEEAGVTEVDLLTHDMGDTVGGELLARSLEDELPFSVRRRVLVNGSIYIEMADLRDAQEMLLDLPDEALDEDLPKELFVDGLRGIFGRDGVSDDELDAQWELVNRDHGSRLAPRLIRYVDERHRHQDRWTGAIERHPSPLTIVWADADPVAVVAMAERLAEAVPHADYVRLPGVGHFPMIEAPVAFARIVLDALAPRLGEGR